MLNRIELYKAKGLCGLKNTVIGKIVYPTKISEILDAVTCEYDNINDARIAVCWNTGKWQLCKMTEDKKGIISLIPVSLEYNEILNIYDNDRNRLDVYIALGDSYDMDYNFQYEYFVGVIDNNGKEIVPNNHYTKVTYVNDNYYVCYKSPYKSTKTEHVLFDVSLQKPVMDIELEIETSNSIGNRMVKNYDYKVVCVGDKMYISMPFYNRCEGCTGIVDLTVLNKSITWIKTPGVFGYIYEVPDKRNGRNPVKGVHQVSIFREDPYNKKSNKRYYQLIEDSTGELIDKPLEKMIECDNRYVKLTDYIYDFDKLKVIKHDDIEFTSDNSGSVSYIYGNIAVFSLWSTDEHFLVDLDLLKQIRIPLFKKDAYLDSYLLNIRADVKLKDGKVYLKIGGYGMKNLELMELTLVYFKGMMYPCF